MVLVMVLGTVPLSASMVVEGCVVVSSGFIDGANTTVGSRAMGKPPKQSDDQPENGFKRLGARLHKVTRRSNFSIWLAKGDNFKKLTEEKEKHGVRWDEIAQWAIDEGHTNGKPLTAIGAKRAYEREKARRDRKPRSRQDEVSVSPVVKPEPLVSSVQPAPKDTVSAPSSVDLQSFVASMKPDYAKRKKE